MTDDQFDIIQSMHNEFATSHAAITRKKIARLIAETDLSWASARRIEYLKDCMTDTIMEIWRLQDILALQRRERAIEGMLLTSTTIQEKVKRLISLQGEVIRLKRPGTGEITESDIEQARQYPYTELLPFRNGKATCPFHADKTPSFGVKGNRGKCFSCGWSGDPIDFVRERDGVSFVDAVKRLR